MRVFILICALAFSFTAHADDVQWSKGYIANCDNAVEREDGTPLALSEISRVEYHVDKVEGNITNPAITAVMAGGCQPTAINTKVLTPGLYYVYGRTFDTDGRDSVTSSEGSTKNILKSRPKSGSNYR